MLLMYLTKRLINEITNHKKLKEKRKKRRLQRKRHKKSMIKLFGKLRYYMSWWFGNWTLVAWNNRDYNEPKEKPYQKFYRDETIAKRYAKKLNEKYNVVQLEKVFNRKHKEIGFLLTGKGKKVEETTQQPSNIINFTKYRELKSH